ncbi:MULTISPECIES: hypothetical protein [Clavibacter]|uniref:Uncharacterized protein n=2 Tax=Clavibacter TaxID=1573 RepID=A0A399NXV0_9MICO|nr:MULTISPECIES: hypothetical protein [Clavibacter]KDP90930.1 hypothetical protein W824_09145 [Clavibacter cf. michiganensis LMG 26808]RII98697.1 hypothetical protein DZF96_02010 [Clavibacter michiganensis]UKF25199.1 hypothetical protein KYT88_00465 [Clavibacter sp. A6099]
MSTRRSILRGLIGAAALTATGQVRSFAASASPVSASPIRESDHPWYLQPLAATATAGADDLTVLHRAATAAAIQEGYAPDVVASAVSQATVSVNTRGNRVGKCSLILDAHAVFVLTKEFGTGHLNRQAVQTLWAGADDIVRDLVPAAHAKMMASGESGSIEAADAASSCCTVLGNAIGTCCRYDFQGLFECCGPCAFTFPEIPVFIACVAVWCNYCSAAHCKEWYYEC